MCATNFRCRTRPVLNSSKNIFVELNIDQAKHLMMSKKENLNTPCLSLMARFVGGNWKCHMTDRYVPLVMLDFWINNLGQWQCNRADPDDDWYDAEATSCSYHFIFDFKICRTFCLYFAVFWTKTVLVVGLVTANALSTESAVRK